MMIVNKKEFTVKKDDKEVKLVALRPTQAIRQRSEIEYAKAWGAYAKESGMLLEIALWDTLRKKNLWDDDRQKKLDEINKKMEENEKLLPDENGKVKKKGVTLSQARKAAIDIRIGRMERVRLLSDMTRLRQNTCEGLSENTRFNYLVSECIKYADTGDRYFASLQDYLERSNDKDAELAASEFANLYYDYDKDFDKNLPENSFLLKHKMCREDLSLTDKNGNLVDIDGNLIDDKGERLDKPKESDEVFELEDDWNKEVVLDVNENPSPKPEGWDEVAKSNSENLELIEVK